MSANPYERKNSKLHEFTVSKISFIKPLKEKKLFSNVIRFRNTIILILWSLLFVPITINYYYRTGFCKARAHTVTDECPKGTSVCNCMTSALQNQFCNNDLL